VWPDAHTAALWLAVVAIGAYHGLNPAMGWPLAVANGLSARRGAAVFATLLPLGAGHFLSMAVVLVPFALLSTVAAWSRPVRIGAALLLMGFGVYRLVDRRHPRWLVRIRPTQLALWSFLIATAHGAGLMLLPVALGLCTTAAGLAPPPAAGAGVALLVASVHTAAMLAAGGCVAWLVYRIFGLRLLNRGWLDLETVWAASLVLAGAAGIAFAW